MTTSELDRTQRWMHAAMTDPHGVAEDARAVVNGSPGMPAEQRLELYRRTYHRRLTGCLRDSHPALCHALGEQLFEDFALDYLDAHPPRGPSLDTLGAMFADHLQATRPDRDMPPARRERWPDLLVDLARLERAFLEVYDGPGAEHARTLCSSDLPADGGARAAMRVRPVPCLRLLRVSHRVDEYLLAVRRGEDPQLPAQCEHFVALSRSDWRVTLTGLQAAEHALLTALMRGADLAAASTAATIDHGAAWSCLREWTQRGFFLAGDRTDTEGAS